jgi:hypothetical protein
MENAARANALFDMDDTSTSGEQRNSPAPDGIARSLLPPRRSPARSRVLTASLDAGQLLARLRQASASEFRYGRVRYEGSIYVIAPSGASIESVEYFHRDTADHGGATRYGTFGRATLYGALDPFTAIAQAAHRVLIDPPYRPIQPLALYRLHVRGRFADLHGREHEQPQIIGSDYAPTQAFAARVRHVAGLSGVLYPSARCSGVCLAVFRPQALRSVRSLEAIPMRRMSDDAITVRCPWSDTWLKLGLHDLRREHAARTACTRDEGFRYSNDDGRAALRGTRA